MTTSLLWRKVFLRKYFVERAENLAMRIGILTFQWADNYGGLLQCYALKKYLQKRGYEVNIINYWPIYAIKAKCTKVGITAVKKKLGMSAGLNKKQLLKNLFLGRYHEEKKIAEQFDIFRENYLIRNQQACFDILEIDQYINIKKYDVLICGSDQIWNPNLTGGHFDNTYFLGFSNRELVKVAYAASLGVRLKSEWEKEFYELLKEIQYISARERTLTELIETKYGLSCATVVDPVFLIEAGEWDQLKINGSSKNPYILVYSIHRNSELVSIANWLSGITNLPLHIIGIKHKYNKAKYYRACSVEEFLFQFKHADYIITNSFHGTAFSLIFHKKFLTFLDKEKPARMTDLLADLGLSEHIYTGSNKEVILNPLDFSQVNVKLNKKIQESRTYLDSCITTAERRIDEEHD